MTAKVASPPPESLRQDPIETCRRWARWWTISGRRWDSPFRPVHGLLAAHDALAARVRALEATLSDLRAQGHV